MRTRTLLPAALVASLALVSSPVLADEGSGESSGDASTAECPAPEAIVNGTLEQAAQAAATAAERLAEGDTCLSNDAELAEDSLQAALDRLSADGADNAGVAAQVLLALINGDPVEGIGADHGALVSEAAKARRPEQAGAADEADTGEAADASDVRATPAVPAEPATPEAPATPAVPAEPAEPEIPETPATPEIPETPPVPAPPADVGDAAPPEVPGPVTPGQP